MQRSGRCRTRRQRIVLIIVLVLVVIAGVELGIRACMHFGYLKPVTILPKSEVLEQAWFEPHPYLVYVFKPNASFVKRSFKKARFTTNEFAFRSTLDFDVSAVSKPTNVLRIATMGGSTTMGVNSDDEVWPYLLGQQLREHVENRRIEVLNEGTMGYTSLDNLLDLAMRVIDFRSDIYVIYLGINDVLAAAPLSTYRTDYSHFRKTLDENLNLVSAYPPFLLRFASFRVVLHRMGVPDSRNLIANTTTRFFRQTSRVPKNELESVAVRVRETTVRNVASMIGIIRSHTPEARIVIPSFYDRLGIEIVADLNRDFAELADEYGVVFADVAAAIPRTKEMAYDSVHFTPEGDRLMATLCADVVLHEVLPDMKHVRVGDSR